MSNDAIREVVYTHAVEWKRYDEVGTMIEDENKLFESDDKAEKFIMALKKGVKKNQTLRAVVRELKHNEIVRRLKKEKGKKNFKRK